MEFARTKVRGYLIQLNIILFLRSISRETICFLRLSLCAGLTLMHAVYCVMMDAGAVCTYIREVA